MAAGDTAAADAAAAAGDTAAAADAAAAAAVGAAASAAAADVAASAAAAAVCLRPLLPLPGCLQRAPKPCQLLVLLLFLLLLHLVPAPLASPQ